MISCKMTPMLESSNELELLIRNAFEPIEGGVLLLFRHVQKSNMIEKCEYKHFYGGSEVIGNSILRIEHDLGWLVYDRAM